MIRARWIGAAATTAALGSVLFFRACDPIITSKPTDFSYAGHERPRVFVSHHPLVPRPGAELTLRLEPDLPAGAAVRQATAVLRDPASGNSETKTCDAAGPAFECRFTLGGAAGSRVYGGFLELDNGQRVDARTDYRFTVADAITLEAFIEVRVPENRVQALGDRHRIDTAFVRDPQNYELDPFVADVEKALYDGLLADPVYRWRDDQLGFSLFTHDAFVTSYYSGLNTRCGQNPWPLEAAFLQPLVGIEVVGVLHRKATDSQGVEGGVTAVTPGLFRDCAGNAARSAGVRTFSATMGLARSPFITRHEFGHAAFELGDEYTETNATRNVTAVQPPQASQCCCADDDGTGTTGGSSTGGIGGGTVTPRPGLTPLIAVKRCFGPDGPTLQPGTGLGLPSCGGSTAAFLAQNCGAKAEGGCPLLASKCVAQSTWLGPAPSNTVTDRFNVFPTEDACKSARDFARVHPGVEDADRSLGACRPLCGAGDAPACPCPGQSEAWIVDTNPKVAPTNPRDAMASVSDAGEAHGGTCAWCVESTLCVRWQRALGDGAEKTWQTCQAPGLVQTLLAAFTGLINDVLRHIVF